jgi:hypothetical protein
MQRRTADLHPGDPVERIINPDTGMEDSVGAGLPVYAGDKFIALVKNLRSLERAGYVKRGFVEEVAWDIEEKIIRSRPAITSFLNVKLKTTPGRPKGDDFNTLLYLLILHSRHYMRRPNYRLIDGFLEEHDIKIETTLTYSKLRRRLKLINPTEIEEKYRYWYNDSLTEETAKGTFHRRLRFPSWDSLSRPGQNLDYEPGLLE